MTYELRIERLFDASPEAVFDAYVDPATQEELHGSAQPGWIVHRSETDVREGGTSTTEMGMEGQASDTETRVFSVVDRPNRLVFRNSIGGANWGPGVESEVTITFEDQDGKTLVTVVQSGFENEQGRDRVLKYGWPIQLDILKGIVERSTLKARHDA
jgi:uncharacterized protein YndB with AHSA1/START domain